MSSKECVDALIAWTEQNYDTIPKGDWNFVGERRLKVLNRGHTRVSNWKRRGIKTHGDCIYRIFECKETLFDLSVMFLVIDNNETLSIQAGTHTEFDQYFNTIGYNWGWD